MDMRARACWPWNEQGNQRQAAVVELELPHASEKPLCESDGASIEIEALR